MDVMLLETMNNKMECRINEADLNDSRNKKLQICESSNSLKESCQKARKILNLALSVLVPPDFCVFLGMRYLTVHVLLAVVLLTLKKSKKPSQNQLMS